MPHTSPAPIQALIDHAQTEDVQNDGVVITTASEITWQYHPDTQSMSVSLAQTMYGIQCTAEMSHDEITTFITKLDESIMKIKHQEVNSLRSRLIIMTVDMAYTKKDLRGLVTQLQASSSIPVDFTLDGIMPVACIFDVNEIGVVLLGINGPLGLLIYLDLTPDEAATLLQGLREELGL